MDFRLLAGGPTFTCPDVWERSILTENSPGHLEKEQDSLSFASHAAFRIGHCKTLELFGFVIYLDF